MLVRPNNRPIHEVHVPIEVARGIRLLLDGREDPIPDPGQAPAAEAAVHGGPPAIPLGQITPRGTRPELPQDPVQNPPMVLGRSPAGGLLRRQQRRQPGPVALGELMASPHARAYPLFRLPRRVCTQALVGCRPAWTTTATISPVVPGRIGC
jgi:hypothetical protein